MDKELKKTLYILIKRLINQEVRFLRLKQIFIPEILIDEISRSIEDTKDEVARLMRGLSFDEREALLHKMLKEAVDDEIEKAIAFRKNRC